MPRLRRVAHMCSRTLSDPANRLRKIRKKKSSAVPLFSKRSHIGSLRRIRKQGKGRSSKRKENRRLSFLFAPARRAPQRSRRPQTANPPAEVQRKTSRPERANTLTQFECPAGSVQKRSRPVRANPPAAVRVPRWVGAENPGNPEKIFPPEKAAKTPILTLRKRLSERHS